MSTNAVFDGGAADQQAEYAAAADHYTDADHETFLADKDAISGVDTYDDDDREDDIERVRGWLRADAVHITPAVDRTALCLEVDGTFAVPGALLAQPLPACRECLAIALRLKDIEMHDLARLVADVAATVPVLPLAWQLDTEAIPVRDLATREIVAVRLLLDPAVSLSVIKADLWQEIRADRPHLYAALCAGDVTAAYAAAEAAR